MDRCTDHHNLTEKLLKTVLNTNQSINQKLWPMYKVFTDKLWANGLVTTSVDIQLFSPTKTPIPVEEQAKNYMPKTKLGMKKN